MNTPSSPRHRIIEAPGSILRLLFVTIAILAFGESTAPADDALADAVLDIAFESTPPLPDGEGLAGAIAGRSGAKIIIAGGANFPNEPRWETEKVWHDAVQVLDLSADSPAWTTLSDRLPGPIAYGVSLTHPTRGVISIGGADADEHLDDAFILTVDRDRLIRSPLPDLPSPLAYAAGVLVGDVVVVMGGQATPGGPASAAVYTLDLSNLDSTTTDPAWRTRPVIPTGGRILPVAATHQGEVFLFSGVALEADGDGGFRRIAPYLVEALAFDPRSDSDTWRTLADLPRPAAAAAGPAIPVGFDLLAIVGGDDGSQLARISDLEDDHPGFPDDVLVYHPITDRWTVRGRFPRDRATDREPPVTAATIPVTGTGTSLDGGVLLASGEIRPRKRTPELAFIRAIVPVQPLAAIDWIAIAGYGLVLVWMGVHFSRRENGTEDYFLAGRRIPWWAAGISIFATSLSAITFMAIPAKSWSTDWIYFLQNLGILAVAPLAAFLLVPYFRRLDVVTAYEYLERRFHWSLRLAASALYMLFQVGRVAVVTLLPALALTAITGLDVTWCILLMGGICIAYTVLGGVEAVIWSDVLQAVILLGGAIWALMILLNGTDGGFAGMLADAGDSGKLRLVDPVLGPDPAVAAGDRARCDLRQPDPLRQRPVRGTAISHGARRTRGEAGDHRRRRPRHSRVAHLLRPRYRALELLPLEPGTAPADGEARPDPADVRDRSTAARHLGPCGGGPVRRGDEQSRLRDELGLDRVHDRLVSPVPSGCRRSSLSSGRPLRDDRHRGDRHRCGAADATRQ